MSKEFIKGEDYLFSQVRDLERRRANKEANKNGKRRIEDKLDKIIDLLVSIKEQGRK